VLELRFDVSPGSGAKEIRVTVSQPRPDGSVPWDTVGRFFVKQKLYRQLVDTLTSGGAKIHTTGSPHTARKYG
jgi:hypothetical protein